MLIGFSDPGFDWIYATHPTPNTTSGTQHGASFTSGSDPSEASVWTQLIAGASCTYDIWRTWLMLSNYNVNNNARQMVLDIGVDPAGGTSYTEVISEFTCGTAGDVNSGDRHFWFPLFIKAGSSVGFRARGTSASVGYVAAVFFGRPKDPSQTWVARYTETIGKGSGVAGTVLAGSPTPVGVSGAKGSVQSLGSSTKRLKFFQLGAQVDDTSSSARTDYWDIFAGAGTDMGRDAIIRNMRHAQAGSTETYGHGLELTAFRDCPSGTTFYARAATSIATADSNYNCTLLGFGD